MKKEYVCRQCQGAGEIYGGNEWEGPFVEECDLCDGTGIEVLDKELVYEEV